MTTLIPAYGRDYKSAATVKADWAAGKDFIIADMFDKYDGKPVNKQDADRAGMQVMIRYSGLRKIVAIS